MQASSKIVLRKICLALFAGYVLVLAYFLFFSDGYGRTTVYEEYRYNLIPFQEIKRFYIYSANVGMIATITNIGGNILAFMPFGALIRWVRNKKTSIVVATGYTFLFSLAIELVQLVTRVGVFDVDDLILNTLGGVFGFLVYMALAVLDKRVHNKLHAPGNGEGQGLA
ncbi:MAG: VanZ family protein [Lachnospiraceae bacterium]|nr:VanZ family protein [Lachnospiraceae bacterium]